ncbi:MAG: ISL3 family transposase [Thermosynechococcaceae cyanobacterium]
MELLEYFLPCQDVLHLEGWELDTTNAQITMSVSSTQVVAHCPICDSPAHRVHSRYERTLRDLPCVDFCLTILLQVCKFFCLNEDCPRRIFTERLPEVAVPWARRTVRFSQHLSAMGLALGGAAAARLSCQINYDNSRNTMLRAISKLVLPPIETPKILGVDDFALRRGQVYGTILVNLETHRPIALLPDREADTLAHWLKEHPGVEVLSRDRSKTYKAGMNEGAPQAIQVADRFHLLQNLEAVVEKVFQGQAQVLKTIEITLLKAKMAQEGIDVDGVSTVTESAAESRVDPASEKALNRAYRLEKYEQTHALRKEGYMIKDIAHHLGIGKRTVYTYLAAPSFPERQSYKHQRHSGLDAYKPYLLQQWNTGHHHSKQLYKEIQLQGYQGSYETVARFTHPLRQLLPQVRPVRESLNNLPGRGPAPAKLIVKQKSLTPRRAAWLVMRKVETLQSDEEDLLEQMSEHSDLSVAIALAQSFLFLVRKRLPQHLDLWIERAKNSSLQAFQSFAKGIVDDYDAVKAGMTLEVSNGPVEGQNNRLKMVKRQMFGRAGLDLLSKRLILTG